MMLRGSGSSWPSWHERAAFGFSVVIPTLQRARELDELVESCAAHPLVHEVLVVNNAPEPLSWESPKVRVLHQATNIFVNPAWNLGVKESHAGLLAILNDDVLFDTILFDKVVRWLRLPWVGIIGPDPSCFEREVGDRMSLRPVIHRPDGFGTVLFMRRDNYVEIPDDLQIWFGDDWLFSRQQRPNWAFKGIRIVTPMSVTSAAFAYRAHAELLTYRAYGEGGYHQRFGALQKVYSWLRALAGRLSSSGDSFDG